MKNLSRIIFFILIFLSSTTGYTDEHDSKEELQENPQNEKNDISDNEQNKNKPVDSFIPTENISEDFSVPFPIDI